MRDLLHHTKAWLKPLILLAFLSTVAVQSAQATCYVWMPTVSASGSCVSASFYPAAYGPVLTMWAKNVGGNIIPVTSWSFNTSMTFCPSQPGKYRLCAKRIGCSKIYESGDVYIGGQCYPLTNPGSISGSSGTYCGSFNPPAFSGTSASGGSGGNIKYQWQYRTPGGTWKNAQASGCKSKAGYNPPTLHQSYQFRRLAKRHGCGNWIASNVISITITSSLSNGGHISGDNGIQCEGFNPGAYYGSKPGGASGATVIYKWQYRTVNGQWTNSNAPGSSSKSGFNPGPLTETTKFRRLAKIQGCGNWKCSNTITIYIKQGPVVTTSPDEVICEGESVTLTASATGCGPFSYDWNQGLGTGASKMVTPSLPAYQNKAFHYQVTVTDGNGCESKEKVKVSVRSTPQVTVNSTNPSCNGNGGSISFTITDHPNRTGIAFSIDGGATWPNAYKTQDNIGTFTISNLAAGDYDLLVRWGNQECPVDLGSENLSDLGGPTVNAGQDVKICEGETAFLSASATGNGPFTYQWNKGLGAGQQVSVTPVLSQFKNKGFNYTVTVTDGNGCTGTDVVNVFVRSQPDVSVSSTDPTCVGGDGSITFTFPDHPNRSHIEFSTDGGATWPASQKVQDNTGSFSLTNLASGTYDLYVRWGNDQCPVDLPDATLAPTGSGCASLGDFVWYDDDRDGIQDPGETGVQGVTVNLYKCGESTSIDSKDTDINGFYQFDNLLPGMSYYVEFVPATLPSDYEFTGQSQGTNPALDSDADANGITACVSLSAGEFYQDLDAGIFQPVASLGDIVWNDIDKDGEQDANEPGIDGVTVILSDCSGNFISSTTTINGGLYAFTGLNPGDYKVTFDPSSLPAGFVFTSQFSGSDDSKDSDANPASGMTECITLSPGENNIDIDAGAYPSVNCNADAGTVRMACESATFCRQFGRANIYGWPNTDRVIPSGFTSAYLLVSVASGSVEQVSAYPDFEVTYNGDFVIHSMVYNNTNGDADFFDLGSISPGITSIADVASNFLVGGGTKCGDVNTVGSSATVISCVDPGADDDYAYTSVDMPVSGNLRLNDGNPYGHPLWIRWLVTPENGSITLAPDGSFTYTPDAGFIGLDSARYRLTDTTLCNHRNSYAWLYITVSATETTEPQEQEFGSGPVVWLETSVEKDGMANVLTWVTLEDTVPVNYEVQRSVDGVIYERIHSTPAVGSPGEPQTYTFVEDGTEFQDHSQVFYRVQSVDPQGYFTQGETVVLHQDIADMLMIEVYPVPATTDVFATWSYREAPVTVTLVNNLGQVFNSKQLETGEMETGFDVTDLPPGIYHLQVSTGGYMKSKSFIVE